MAQMIRQWWHILPLPQPPLLLLLHIYSHAYLSTNRIPPRIPEYFWQDVVPGIFLRALLATTSLFVAGRYKAVFNNDFSIRKTEERAHTQTLSSLAVTGITKTSYTPDKARLSPLKRFEGKTRRLNRPGKSRKEETKERREMPREINREMPLFRCPVPADRCLSIRARFRYRPHSS